MAAQEMAGLMRDDAGKLRLVPHPGEEAGEDDHEAGRRHECVEFRDVRQVDAQILRGGAADTLGEHAEIGGQRLVLDQQIRIRNLLLHPFILLPQALLVLLGRPVAGLNERGHRARRYPRLGGRAETHAARAAEAAEQGSPRDDVGHRACSLTFRPAFMRPSRRSTICAEPSGVRMSPNDMPGSWLPVCSTLNQTTSPVRKSTSEA